MFDNRMFVNKFRVAVENATVKLNISESGIFIFYRPKHVVQFFFLLSTPAAFLIEFLISRIVKRIVKNAVAITNNIIITPKIQVLFYLYDL